MKQYTIGELFRLGVFKNKRGKPYKHKATISRIVNSLDHTEIDTKWGSAKAISQEVLDAYLGKA